MGRSTRRAVVPGSPVKNSESLLRHVMSDPSFQTIVRLPTEDGAAVALAADREANLLNEAEENVDTV